MLDRDVLSSIGLLLDIAGVVLLFFFGLPSDAGNSSGGMTIDMPAGDQTEGRVKKYQRYKTLSRVALGLLLVGFLLQIVSNHLPAAPNPGNVPTYASAPIFSAHWMHH